MKVAIIGGGAAGLAAAVKAAEKHSVTVFERSGRVGRKIMASGNGRCNLTNAALTADNYADFLKYYNCERAADTVRRFDYNALKSFFESMGLEMFSDEQGRVYPFSENSGSVLDVLRVKCQKLNVKTVTDSEVVRVEKGKSSFKVMLHTGEFFFFDKVICAIGSKAQVNNFSKLEHLFGEKLEMTYLCPSLTPIKTKKMWLPLNGLRVKCNVSLFANGKKIKEEFGEVLFRDYGLSGIVIFNISSCIAAEKVKGLKNEYKIVLDLFPQFSLQELIEKLKNRAEICGKQTSTFFVGLFHNKIADAVIKKCGLGEELRNSDFETISAFLKNITFEVQELCGYDKCQVVSGGIKFDEVDENFESKKLKGLYFVGECLDADGVCGGFNLHFAFASGIIAGSSL